MHALYQPLYQPNAYWTMPRVGYTFSAKDPFESTKKLRDQAVKLDDGAIFTSNQAISSHAPGDITVALEANANTSKAWTDVKTEAQAALGGVNVYSHTPGADQALVTKWKSEGALYISGVGARLASLDSDRKNLLSLHVVPGLTPPPGTYQPPGTFNPPGANDGKTDWDTVAGNAAIVAVVSAVVYTGWKVLTKGSL